jgi:uncharacterized membrane protein HdeD (DUF308 family)
MKPKYYEYIFMFSALILSVLLNIIWNDIISSFLFTGILFLFIGLYYFSIGIYYFTSIIIIVGFFLLVIGMVSSVYRRFTKRDERTEKRKKQAIVIENKIKNYLF